MKTKTTTIIAALAICMMAAGARAQENGTLVKPNLPKNELKVSFGFWPMNKSFELNGYDWYETLKYHEKVKNGNYEWETHVIGSFSVTYKINFSDKWTLVFNGAMSRKTRDLWYKGVYTETYDCFYFYSQTGLQYNHINKDNFSLYSSFSEGIGIEVWRILNKKDKTLIDPALSFHITFIGMSIGKNHCADIELGLGTQGLLNIGYSRKF